MGNLEGTGASIARGYLTTDSHGEGILFVAEKKLRQIAELKELKAGGKPLEKNQLEKVEQEASVVAELEALTLKLKSVGEQGKWR